MFVGVRKKFKISDCIKVSFLAASSAQSSKKSYVVLVVVVVVGIDFQSRHLSKKREKSHWTGFQNGRRAGRQDD